MKDRINIDHIFAKVLDLGCNLCDFQNNTIQLENLRQRGIAYPEEKRATDALSEHCKRCIQRKDPSNTITARLSCCWRSGIG